MQRHPLEGVRALLRSPGITPATINSMTVAFEHHRGLQEEGYPSARDYGEPTLFGRIVNIADCYDALRTPRPYRPRSLSPVETLQVMLQAGGYAGRCGSPHRADHCVWPGG